ncbi:hypothetical protein [uncultured Sphaerochaeta sp.]|uniref:hypothetical protein n=1 Tax=uncultured Sphaerochaeta sp. TaxID=886478 RepID=UPI002A0A1331|nr:hypothetical protein [uncultured Sphaerochaeta sp.]
MKKKVLGVLLVLISCLFLVSVLSSCNDNPRSKALVIVNDSDNEINLVEINQYISGAKIASSNNALDGEETIAAGKSKTFYLAPYSEYRVGLFIRDDASGYDDIEFTYDYAVNGRNEAITASYDGTEITVTGSNAAELPPV